MDYANDMLFGDSGNSRLTATDLSPYARDPNDFGAVLLTGITNITMQAMQNKVNEATASGQLYYTGNGVGMTLSSPLIKALLIGGVIYFLVKAK